MIFVDSNQAIARAYAYEALRRLWAISVDENGNFVNFDYYYNISPVRQGRIELPFDDVYSPAELQNQIVNEILNEPYCLPSGKIYKLNKSRYEQSIRFTAVLGPSPWSCKRTFAEKHPKFEKIKEKFE